MFNNYKSNFHLDLWESCENETVGFPIKRNSSFNRINQIIEKFDSLNEAIEVEGKWYNNLEDLYHVGSAKKFDDTRLLLNTTNPMNLKKKFPKDSQYPIDFFIQFIDPKTLKVVSFMIVYEQNPFGEGSYGGQKNCCRLILYKTKAFAMEKTDTKHKFAFIVKNARDIKNVKENPSLRIIWQDEPRKTIPNLKPSEIQNELLAAVKTLNSNGYIVIDDFDDTIERILNAAR